MGKVVAFKPKLGRNNEQVQKRAAAELHARQTLAKWLREMADLVEADAMEVEPLAAVLVLSGRESNEVLNVGYGFEDVSFEAACKAPGRRWMCRDTDISIFPV